MKPPVARWLEFAEIDLKAAKALLKDRSAPTKPIEPIQLKSLVIP